MTFTKINSRPFYCVCVWEWRRENFCQIKYIICCLIDLPISPSGSLLQDKVLPVTVRKAYFKNKIFNDSFLFRCLSKLWWWANTKKHQSTENLNQWIEIQSLFLLHSWRSLGWGETHKFYSGFKRREKKWIKRKQGFLFVTGIKEKLLGTQSWCLQKKRGWLTSEGKQRRNL